MRIQMAPDLELSRVAWGFWRWAEWGITVEELSRLTEEVIDLGITTIDHADSYAEGQAEIAFGKVLKSKPHLRDKIELITKCTLVYPWTGARVKYYDTSKDYIIKQVETSLSKLNVDYIDLLLMHRPDPLMQPEETAAAFDQLYQQGKVKNFGVSNYKPSDFAMLQSFVDQKLVTNQIEVSVLQHENFDNGTVSYAMQQRIHPIVWSPLAGGRIFTSDDEVAVRVRAELETVRQEIGAENIDEVALAWLFTHPVGFIPITGACEMEFIRRPVEAFKYRLNREQWFAIWSAQTGRRVP